MVGSATLLLLVLIVFGSYIGIKYSQSRNKKLFFKNGNYKAFLWSLAIVFIAPIILNVAFPYEPTDLSFLKFHSGHTDSLDQLKQDGQYPTYYLVKVYSIFSEMHILGLVSALLVFGTWFFYVRNLDFFDREKMKISIIAVLLGALFSVFTFPISDAVHALFNISFSDNTFYNLFIYSFVGIGLIEELVKIIPVIIIYYFTNEIDEPIDFIYYACLSALGFATIENLIYFQDIDGSIVIARALTSAVGHMVDSSIVVYGFILVQYKKPQNPALTILKYYLIGSFVHALYDYFILEGLLLFFVASFILFIQAWMIIINNAINNSKFFDYCISFKHDYIKFKLAEYLVYILIINYFFNGLLVGKMDANYEYIISLGYISLLIIFYVSSISSFDLVKGYWRPVRLQFSAPNDEALPGARGMSTFRSFYSANTITPLNHVGKKIKLHCPRFNHELINVFDIGEGSIVDRLIMNISTKGGKGIKDTNWFLVELAEDMAISNEYESRKIMIKILETHASFVHDEHIKCWVKFIPKGLDPAKVSDISQYLSYGYIMINGEDYEYDVAG